MAFLKHVSPRPEMTDYAVANTGIKWVGQETKEVPDGVAHKFLQHPDVWQFVKNLAGDPFEDEPQVQNAAPVAPPLAAPAGALMQFTQPMPEEEPWTIVDRDTPDSPVDLDLMDLRTLRAFAIEAGLDVSRTLNTELTRSAVLSAALAKPYKTT